MNQAIQIQKLLGVLPPTLKLLGIFLGSNLNEPLLKLLHVSARSPAQFLIVGV